MNYWPWIGFTAFIVLMLAMDLGLFQRKPHVISVKEALTWFGVWFCMAMLFNIGITVFHERGTEAGLEFFTGFLVEKSLSIDNSNREASRRRVLRTPSSNKTIDS